MPVRARPSSALPGIRGGASSQHSQGGILSSDERFPKDFWLTSRTVLTRVTPISKLNHFCVRHGAHCRHHLSFIPAVKHPAMFIPFVGDETAQASS